MDRDEALEIIRSKQISIWNKYREQNTNWVPDFSDETIERDRLDGIDLSRAKLSRATLAGDFRDANFSQSDLSEASLAGEIRRADFTSANLCGADLSDAINGYYTSDNAKFDGAKFDSETEFPFGVDPIEAGAQFVSRAQKQRVVNTHSQCFISYAWADEDVVNAMDAWLRRKGITTKLDKRDFFAGARIRDEIMRVMKECDTILIFHSSRSADKPWPEFERELAGDLEMAAKKEGQKPPRIIYIVIDNVGLPSVSEENKLAVVAKGKRFEFVCEEIYHGILQLPREAEDVELDKWSDYVF